MNNVDAAVNVNARIWPQKLHLHLRLHLHRSLFIRRLTGAFAV
jgi:hypothetical protein